METPGLNLASISSIHLNYPSNLLSITKKVRLLRQTLCTLILTLKENLDRSLSICLALIKYFLESNSVDTFKSLSEAAFNWKKANLKVKNNFLAGLK